MIKIGGNFTPISEGVHIFKITGVENKEDFGKLLVHMVTKEGKKHTEVFRLMKSNNEPNPGAMTAFSFFAKAAMNDFDLEEIEEQDLVGHYIKCTVEHNKVESNRTPGKILTFVQLGDKEPADGFEGEDEDPEEILEAKEEETDDVDDILKGLLG